MPFMAPFLDLLLWGSSWKSFHNCLCWLCLHLGLLTENHLSACLCGWLAPGLDAAETWDGEHTCLLDFLCSNSNRAVQDIRTVLSLHVMLSGDRLQQFTLCPCLREPDFIAFMGAIMKRSELERQR